jgi:hypothetical protein
MLGERVVAVKCCWNYGRIRVVPIMLNVVNLWILKKLALRVIKSYILMDG